jgi:hypothetical protein
VSGIRYHRVTGYEQWTGKHAATTHQDVPPGGHKEEATSTTLFGRPVTGRVRCGYL